MILVLCVCVCFLVGVWVGGKFHMWVESVSPVFPKLWKCAHKGAPITKRREAEETDESRHMRKKKKKKMAWRNTTTHCSPN